MGQAGTKGEIFIHWGVQCSSVEYWRGRPASNRRRVARSTLPVPSPTSGRVGLLLGSVICLRGLSVGYRCCCRCRAGFRD